MKSLVTWKFIVESIRQDLPVMLLYVLESSGSSPGRKGFNMAVNAAGSMEGSLGGGIMEHKFVELSKARLAEQSQEISIHLQVHNKTSATHQSGMICSGEQTILLYAVQKKDCAPALAIISMLEQSRNGILTLSPEGIQFEAGVPTDLNTGFTSGIENAWMYREIIGYQNHLYIVGGGHCALALSRIMLGIDFYIHLFDDRQELKTMAENDFAHEKKILVDYRELAALIHPGDRHYVVIMTVGYRTDAIALRALVDKKFRYLGLLGSESKTAKMISDLRKEGFDAVLLNRVHAPVGLPIKSQTPEEVAISIAAEIIRKKNG